MYSLHYLLRIWYLNAIQVSVNIIIFLLETSNRNNELTF